MIQYGNKLLPDTGKIFKTGKEISFTVSLDADYEELEINLKNINTFGNIAIVDNLFAILLEDGDRPLKARLVNKIFSNDDQIAIMLNYQSHPTAENISIYNSMQEWRDWFGELVKSLRGYGTQNT